MALFNEVKCGRCDRRYSAIRSRCPYCGARKNRDGKAEAGSSNNRLQVIIGVAVLLVVIIAVVALVASSLEGRDPEDLTPDPSPTNSVPSEQPTDNVEPSSEPTPPEDIPTPATPEPVVNSIILNREDFTLFTIGEKFEMIATLSPAGTPAEIIWISEDSGVATIDENGVVTAVNRGDTIISATAGGKTAQCVVRVRATAVPAPAGSSGGSPTGGMVTLSAADVTIHSATAESFRLTVSGTDETPAFSSSKPGVADVDDRGNVKAVSNGTATITVKVKDSDGNEVTLECIVRVVN